MEKLIFALFVSLTIRYTDNILKIITMKGLRLVGQRINSPNHTSLESLKGKTIYNHTVILQEFGSNDPSEDKPVFKCKVLFLDKCDKNFVCFWLDRAIFPNVTDVYINSHPCEPYVLNRDLGDVYLHQRYETYKHRWWPESNNIKIISDMDYQKLLDLYQSEDIQLNKSKL